MTPYTPFIQSSMAQDIIQRKLAERDTPTTVNSAGMYRNPIYDIRAQQELAGELDATTQFPNPLVNNLTPPSNDDSDDSDDSSGGMPNCDDQFPGEGRIYDPILKACVLPQSEGDRDDGEEIDPEKAKYQQMLKDPNTPFGASNILDDYITQGMGEGTFLKFDPSVGRLGSGSINPYLQGGGMILDALFGMPQRRQNTYNDAVNTLQDLGYGQSAGNDLFQVYSPNQYFKSVANNMVNPVGNQFSIAEAVQKVIDDENKAKFYDTATGTTGTTTGSGGAPIAQDLGGSLLYTDRLTTQDSKGNITGRDDNAYRAEIARNIERNKRNNPYGMSGFSMNVGDTGRAGFTRGR